MFEKKNKKETNEFFEKSTKYCDNWVVTGLLDFEVRNIVKFRKAISNYAKMFVKVNYPVGQRPNYVDLVDEVNRILSQIDTEADHDHGGELNIEYVVDENYEVYIRLFDSGKLWKEYHSKNNIYFSIDLNDTNEFAVFCSAGTPMEDIPKTVHFRLKKTWKYIYEQSRTWARELEKKTEELKTKMIKEEFGQL